MTSKENFKNLLEAINQLKSKLTITEIEQIDIEKVMIDYEFSKAAEKYEAIGKYCTIYSKLLKDLEIENILF